MKSAVPLLLLALSGCGDGRGEGIYPETPAERRTRAEAKYLAGERLGIDGLRRELAALGVKESEYSAVTEPDHGIEVLELRIAPDRLAELDPDALARLVLDSNFRLTFSDPDTERAVGVGEEMYRRETATEIAELKRHGDWHRVPRSKPGEPMASFARRIENWCDFEPGQALRVIDGRWLEYSHAPVDMAVAEPVPGDAAARFDCLRRVVYATQLRRHFIGYRGEPPPPVY